MTSYCGITPEQNIKIFQYIKTYHNTDSELREVYMETDAPLQRLVKNHHLKISLYKTTFTMSVYAFFYGVSILIQG